MKNNVYYKLRKKGKLTAVFLHGLGGDLAAWDYYEKTVLELGLSFLSVDLRGHGLSERLEKPIPITEFAMDIVLILKKEKIKKIILFGHCFGGMVSQELAFIVPEKIKKIILVSTFYKVPFWHRLTLPFLPIIKTINLGPVLEHVDYSKYIRTADFNSKRLFSDWKHVGLKSYLNIYLSLKDWDTEKKLNKLKIPSVIAGGEHDLIFTVKNQKEFAQKIRGAKLRILPVNHIAPVSYPEIIKKLIIEEIVKARPLH